MISYPRNLCYHSPMISSVYEIIFILWFHEHDWMISWVWNHVEYDVIPVKSMISSFKVPHDLCMTVTRHIMLIPDIVLARLESLTTEPTSCSLPWKWRRLWSSSAAPEVTVCQVPLRLRIKLASQRRARLQAIACACAALRCTTLLGTKLAGLRTS